jgi:patatin-like phospholipase/acyl hydrolase
MVAASEGSFPPQSSRDLNDITPADVQSHLASILSPAPLGLGAGYTAADLLDLYVRHGGEVFPPFADNAYGRLRAWLHGKWHYARYIYDQEALKRLLTDQLGDRLFGASTSRLCIPSFDGKHSEVFVFKTPHHEDYKFDRFEHMVDVGLATSAAPSYFRPLDHGGYTLVDGGVWANNPTMIAVIETLISFDVDRGQIDVLSLGCGDDRYVLSSQITKGGPLVLEGYNGRRYASAIACRHEPSAAASRFTRGRPLGRAHVPAEASTG